MKKALYLCLLALLGACNTQSRPVLLQLPGFDWTNRKEVILPAALNEISGIVYEPRSASFLAINDEEGLLFQLDPVSFSIRQSLPFGKKGDYECVNTNGDQVFVLKSNGQVWGMELEGSTISAISPHKFTGPASEFEATLWDPNLQRLLVISKKSDADKQAGATHIYSFDPVSGSYKADAVARLNWQAIRDKAPGIKSFHPSAAAIQPGTGHIYIVSSIEKLLLICNQEWQVLSAFPLDKQLFRQPEGIAFDPDGNLIITNEAAGAQPTLIFIPRIHK